MVARLREKLTSERLADRVRRMQLEFDRAADAGDGPDGDGAVIPAKAGTQLGLDLSDHAKEAR